MTQEGEQPAVAPHEEDHTLERDGTRKHARNDEGEAMDTSPPTKQIRIEEATGSIDPVQEDEGTQLPSASVTRAESGPTTKEGEAMDTSSPTKQIRIDEATSSIDSAQEDERTQLPLETVIPTKEEPAEARARGKQGRQPFEEPFKYLAPDHAELDEIYAFYEISARFPRDRYMVRNVTGEPNKAIYYTARAAKDILTENEGKSVKFVHAGVKMFVRQDVHRLHTCKWRVQMEGLPILAPWLSEKRVVRLYRRQTLRRLLVESFPRFGYDGWMQMGEMGERIRDIEPGCCILRVEPTDDPDGFRESMVLPLWKGLQSLNLMMPKEDRQALLLRLYGDMPSIQQAPITPSQPDTVMDEEQPLSAAENEDTGAAQDADAELVAN